MRKLFAIGIAAALALSTGVVVFAESSEKTIGGNESQSINVIAKRTDTTENNVVYSVDMKWDDMTFTYHEKSTRVWNPPDHTYSEKIIGGGDKNTADILVTNHSNADVKVGFVYKTAGNTDLTATLDVTESTLKAGVENDYEHADNVTSKLTLSGKPNETVSESGCKIGTITITVSADTLSSTTAGSNTSNQQVKGTYRDDTNATVYSVDIEWSNFNFEYNKGSKGTWDPATHKYSEPKPAGWGDQTGTIKMTNHSNADVGYTLTCSVDSEYSDFYLGTSKDSMLGSTTGTLKTAENTAVEDAPSTQLTIYPGGSLPAGTNDANVATLTITIGAK